MKSLTFTNFLIAIIFITIISSCSKSTNQKSPQDTAKTKQMNKDSIKNLASGNYMGKIPCADCEGIEYTLILQPSMDFASTYVYLGKSVAPFESKGKWKMIGDSIITLESNSDVPTYLRVYHNDSLEMLDNSMKKISGPIGGNYILRKVNLKK